MALEDRVATLEREMRELTELVDGQQPWSHRKRLHEIENSDRGVEWAQQALKAYRETRDNRMTHLREWGGFALALAAITVSVWR